MTCVLCKQIMKLHKISRDLVLLIWILNWLLSNFGLWKCSSLDWLESPVWLLFVFLTSQSLNVSHSLCEQTLHLKAGIHPRNSKVTAENYPATPHFPPPSLLAQIMQTSTSEKEIAFHHNNPILFNHLSTEARLSWLESLCIFSWVILIKAQSLPANIGLNSKFTFNKQCSVLVYSWAVEKLMFRGEDTIFWLQL